MIIFMGVAGSGKSVQGRMLADTLGLPWLSTGEFLRMLISGDRRKDMLQGKLLNDQEIISLVQKIFTIVDPKSGLVLDGFPRTVAQADWLLNQVKHGQLQIRAVVNLKASLEVVRLRLEKRGRQDDNDEGIKKRFQEYEQSMLPILEHFKEARIPIVTIDAEQDVQAIHDQIMKSITKNSL